MGTVGHVLKECPLHPAQRHLLSKVFPELDPIPRRTLSLQSSSQVYYHNLLADVRLIRAIH